jgi:hypothetical protein
MKRVCNIKLSDEVEVLTDGLSGDLVSGGSFAGRMGRRCALLMLLLECER